MKKNLCACLVLFISLFYSGYSHGKDVIKVGLIAPLTGDVKTFGGSTKNAFNIALEEYAKTGKYKIEPIIADDRNDPTEGVTRNFYFSMSHLWGSPL